MHPSPGCQPLANPWGEPLIRGKGLDSVVLLKSGAEIPLKI